MSNEVTKTERDQSVKLDVTATVYPRKNPKMEKGQTLANAIVVVGDCFAVHGVKIVEGKEGPFVAMPNQLGRDKQYHDICYPVTAAMREALNAVVMDAYRDALEQQAIRAVQAVERLSEPRPTKPSVRGALQGAMKEAAARPQPEGQRVMDQGAR